MALRDGAAACTGPPAEVLSADALRQLYGPVTGLYRHRPGGGA